MRIFRATNTAALEYINEKLRPADGVSKEQYLENLGLWIKNAPETIMLMMAFEEDEIQAFMIAYLPPSVNYVFISQIWSENENLAHDLLTRLIEWADSCNRTQLRMESESDHDGYSKLWGFKTITETRAIELSEFYTGAGPTHELGTAGSEGTESTTSGPTTDTPVLTGNLPADDPDASGDIRDRASAQDEALQHSVEGESKGSD